MAAITAADINRLRQTTGAGMLDCKKALEESEGDFEGAIDALRKRGQKVMAKRADRDAKEGIVMARTTPDHTKGIVFKLTSETDFVAKNEEFIAFAQHLADSAVSSLPRTVEEFKALQLKNGSVSDELDAQVTRIGEKIDVVDYTILEAPTVVAYNHSNRRVGVLIGLSLDSNSNIVEAGKDAAMQIAAMNPVAVSQDDVAPEVIERELNLARETTRAEGKAENMIEKISQGKLNKFFKENTLMSQDFVKDPSKSIKSMLEAASPGLTVTTFKRVALGE